MKMGLLHLALQNLRMRKFRTLGIVVAIAIASSALFSSIMLMKSMSSTLELGMAQLGADIMVLPGGAEPEGSILLGTSPGGYFSLSYADRIATLEDVAGVAPIVMVETREGCCFREGVYIVGFDPARDFIVNPWVEKQVGALGAFEAIAGSGYGWIPGSQIQLYGFTFTVVARMPATGVASFDRGVFIPVDRLYWLAERSREYPEIADMPLKPGQVSALMVQLEPDADPVSIARAIEFQFPELRAVVAEKALSNVKRQMQVLLRSLLVLSALTWLTAVILVSVILSMSVNERRREFGILRALGATKRFIFGQVVVEAYLLATAGSVLGMLTGYLFLSVFQELIVGFLRMPYLLPSKLYVALISIATIDVALVLATVASFYPAYRSAELEPYDAIRLGER